MLRARDSLEYWEAIHRVKIGHLTEQGFDIHGVIHVGANNGEEVAYYRMMGIFNILCFEPLPSALAEFRSNHPNVPCYEMALGAEEGEVLLNVSYGDGKGSSLLNPILDHPEVVANWNQGQADIIGKIPVRITRLDTFFRYNSTVKIEDYDTLVLDTQGTELDVLRGCGTFLNHFKYLSVELSDTSVYDKETPGRDVIDWLVARGFTQDSPLCSHDDVYFVRSDIKPVSDCVYRGLA